MSEACTSDCSSCGQSCSSRKPSREDMLKPANSYSRIQKVIGVVSGKGGVGKSFVTSYLASLLNRRGHETAVLDADITGPSIPKAFGIHEKAAGNQLGVFPSYSKKGVKVMSVNLLLEEEEMPVIWRGPVVAGTVEQFWSEVVWGDVNYMFVDMPPGTGDVPLTVFQSIPLDGIIIVTSPQQLVSMIVGKAVNMAKAMNIPILGIVENYSYIECPDCQKKIPVFGESKADELAAKYHLNVLGKLPLNPAIAQAIDAEDVESLEGNWLDEAADYIEKNLPAEKFDGENQYANCGAKKTEAMKIAVAADEADNVFEHFGSCGRFVIFDINENRMMERSELRTSVSGHDGLSQLMKEHGVGVVICGGIGQGAMDALMAAGILVVPGQTGDVDVAAASFIDGSLQSSSQTTCPGHGSEGCGCGCGGGCH